MAERLRAGNPGLPYPEILRAYVSLAASRFRRTTPPPSPQFSPRSPHILWKQSGVEWHAVAGRWDLYLDVVRRSERVLSSRQISDEIRATP